MTKKLVYGFFALWPFVMFAIFFVMMFATDFNPTPQQLFLWGAGTVIFFIGWLLYFWDIFRGGRVPRDKRALWAAVLFFGGPYGMPFYYWIYVLREPQQKSRAA